ncbi:hypothetical protein [Kineococcus radiotolerans]|nr:hypothetical protein [Kineococcus radiotolerans]
MSPTPTVLFEHQPRERQVPCQNCRTATTSNDHAVCTSCLFNGVSVTCGQYCRDVHLVATVRAGLTSPAHLQFA